MKNQRWLAIFTAIVGVLLLGEGWFSVEGIRGLRELEVTPGTPFATAEDVAWAKSYLPAMYVVASEGLMLGVVAAIGAAGLFAGRRWARKLVLLASVVLVLLAVVAVVLAPRQWDTQAVFVGLCAILWWEARKWRKE